MEIIEAFRALRGMRVLGALFDGTLRAATLDDLGYRDAGAWSNLASVYYGATRGRTLQRAAREAAGDLSLDALRVVEKHTKKLLRGAAVSEWELRVELCALRGTVAEIDRLAAARVREYNRAVQDAAKKAYGRRALRGGKNTDAQGLRTFTVTGPERIIEGVLSGVRAEAKQLRRQDPKLGYEQAMFDAFLATGGQGGGAAREMVVTVLPLAESTKVLRQEGDETIFARTDGTTITGAELVAEAMVSEDYVGVFDPVKGGVNLYRDERFANFKQRVLLSAETIVCPHPGCTTPASECQVHHLTAWEKGGNTNIEDLTMLCQVHNARNDDDPDKPPKNGTMVREPGGVVHHPPDGGPPRRNRHPIRDLSAMALARS
ncbi:HNH endonuclease signature motif containing protein [Corynebacterium nasicanis]|uniref:HNH endonuclease signature motif containing protein n=1 Tax=Corynebacterium nasicanis TaxID=1448267 RepID=A0ABW1Q9G9_9CORY